MRQRFTVRRTRWRKKIRKLSSILNAALRPPGHLIPFADNSIIHQFKYFLSFDAWQIHSSVMVLYISMIMINTILLFQTWKKNLNLNVCIRLFHLITSAHLIKYATCIYKSFLFINWNITIIHITQPVLQHHKLWLWCCARLPWITIDLFVCLTFLNCS